MPAILDSCVESLLEKWKADPSKRPDHKADQDAKSQAFSLCTASLKESGKLDHGDEGFYLSEEVDFSNPVMTAWAMTNKPHIMGLDEMSFADADGNPWKDGEKFLKVPLLILGKWKHSLGILNFTEDLIKKLETNFQEGLAGHQISADARHKDALGALAWATGKFFLGMSKAGFKQWGLIAKPTPQGEAFVEQKVYQYASIEVHPNFAGRMLSAATLSADGIEGAWVESCPNLDIVAQEETMPPEITTPTGAPVVDVDAIRVQMEMMQAEFATLKTERDAAQVALESRDTRILQLEQHAVDQFVAGIVLRAEHYRDSETRAHSAAFLQWLEKVLKCEQIGEGDTAITLEGQSISNVHAYYRRAIDHLARTQPGTGPSMTPAGSERDQTPVVRASGDTEDKLTADDEQEISDMWGIVPAGGS